MLFYPSSYIRYYVGIYRILSHITFPHLFNIPPLRHLLQRPLTVLELFFNSPRGAAVCSVPAESAAVLGDFGRLFHDNAFWNPGDRHRPLTMLQLFQRMRTLEHLGTVDPDAWASQFGHN